MTPSGPGNVPLGLDVAVARGIAHELVPGAHADQGAVRLLEQGLGLVKGGVVLGTGGDGHAKLPGRFEGIGQTGLGAQMLHEPGL